MDEKKERRYFVVEAAKRGENGRIIAVVDICTPAARKSSKATAAHMIPEERLHAGYTYILDVKEIPEDEAIGLYGMSAA